MEFVGESFTNEYNPTLLQFFQFLMNLFYNSKKRFDSFGSNHPIICKVCVASTGCVIENSILLTLYAVEIFHMKSGDSHVHRFKYNIGGKVVPKI